MTNREDFVALAKKANEDDDMSFVKGTVFEGYVDDDGKFCIEDITEEEFNEMSKLAEHLDVDVLDKVNISCNIDTDITDLLRRFYGAVSEAYFTDEEIEDQESLWGIVSSGRFEQESFSTKYIKIILGEIRESVIDEVKTYKAVMIINSDSDIAFVSKKEGRS